MLQIVKSQEEKKELKLPRVVKKEVSYSNKKGRGAKREKNQEGQRPPGGE